MSRSLAISSSVTSRMRPGQLSVFGRCSRTIAGSDSFTRALIDTFTASLRLMRILENLSPVSSASITDFSVSAIRLFSSASSMKAPGGITPCSGCRTRANSSTPASCLRRRSILGWYQKSIQFSRSAIVEVDALRGRDRRVELLLPDHALDDGAVDRLPHRRQHLQRIAFAKPRDCVDSKFTVAAYELQWTAVRAVDQDPHRLHCLRRNDRNVEKHQVRCSPDQALAQAVGVGEHAGLDAVPLEHQGHEAAMRFVLIDDEADRRSAVERTFRRRRGLFVRRTKPPTEVVDHAGYSGPPRPLGRLKSEAKNFKDLFLI